MHQDEEGDAQLEQVLRESADQFALEEQLREFARTKSLPDDSPINVVQIRIEEDSDTSSSGRSDIVHSDEGSDVDEDTAFEIALEISKDETTNQTQVQDEDTAFAIALEISKEETTNQTQVEEFDIQVFTEEEILKISEIESNQDNNYTVISCLRNNATSECIFCLEVPVRLEVVRRLRCMHVFHKDCFDEYFYASNDQKNICPICKEAVIGD